MRLLMLVGLTVGGAVGWWLGSYVGIWTALVASAAGTFLGIYVVYRLNRD
jgi:hypothetical protein